MLANKESFSYHSCPNAITLIKSNSKNYFLLYIQSVLCHKQIVQFSNFISFTKKKKMRWWILVKIHIIVIQ